MSAENKPTTQEWIKLAEVAQQNLHNRREFEWKVACGFWVAIAFFTASVFYFDVFKVTDRLKATLMVVYLLAGLAVVLWQVALHSAHAADRAWYVFYINNARGKEPTEPERWPRWTRSNWLWFIAQTALTLLVLGLSYVAITEFAPLKHGAGARPPAEKVEEPARGSAVPMDRRVPEAPPPILKPAGDASLPPAGTSPEPHPDSQRPANSKENSAPEPRPMDTSWFTPSLVVALLALWIGYANYRRNNFAVIRLRACSCSYTRSLLENAGQLFGQLRVEIQNLGIPLHNVALWLRFNYKDAPGNYSYELRAGDQSGLREGQFVKGAIAEFSLKSYPFDKVDVAIISKLEDPRKQRASLRLFADGFLVWEHRLDRWWAPLKRRWNSVAMRINRLFTRRMGTNAEGIPVVKEYTVLPTFAVPSWGVAQFAEYIRKRANSEPGWV
jgi:hypothetical protein